MTMVPDMVVADNISAFKKTGSVPKTAITAIDNLPKVKSFDRLKSTANNFENDDEACVAFIDLIVNLNSHLNI